jgi:hypothetical protein
VTAAAERDDKFHAEYIPPPPPAPGKIVVWAPTDSKGRPICPDLHLTPAQAEQLMDTLNGALNVYLEQVAE